LDKVLRFSNSLSKEDNPLAAIIEMEKEEIVPTPAAEIEVEEEIMTNTVAEIEVEEEIVPTVLAENKEEEIAPISIAEEKPKAEVKNTPIEKIAPTGNPKPYSPHYGSKRSGVWINEK
jgi:hypothetical protein